MGFWKRRFGKQSEDFSTDSGFRDYDEIYVDDDDDICTDEEARYADELVNRILDEGRSLFADPEFVAFMDSWKARLSGNDVSGKMKYKLIEMPAYIKGRKKMAKRGANMAKLDYAIMLLRRGFMPPQNSKPRKLRGDMGGMMECLVEGGSSNWVLVYRYDEEDLVLVAMNRETHKGCGLD